MSNQISQEEFIKKYGEVEVDFSSYYKYTFTYSGTLPDGRTICVRVGGDSSDIYRFEVVAGESTPIACLDPISGSVYEDGKAVEEFY